MAQVQSLEIPDELYGQIEQLVLESQSVPEKIVELLRRAIEMEFLRQQQQQLLESIRADRWTPHSISYPLEPVAVLREIRGYDD
ncbi:MAG: hypothetical protein ACO34J_01880 [Prochlorothrix sp.]